MKSKQLLLVVLFEVAGLGVASPASLIPSLNSFAACIENNRSCNESSFGKLPLYFVKNQGQVHEDVAFYVQGSNKTLFFTTQGVTFSLWAKNNDITGKEEARESWSVKLDFVGANPKCKPKGKSKQKAIFSYFRGKKGDWKTAIPTFSKLVYSDLWQGIDLVYSGTVNQLKYEFIVKPKADPKQIRLAYRGAK